MYTTLDNITNFTNADNATKNVLLLYYTEHYVVKQLYNHKWGTVNQLNAQITFTFYYSCFVIYNAHFFLLKCFRENKDAH